MSFEKNQNINSSDQESAKKKHTIVIADVDIEQQARDIAEEKMLSSKEELKGFGGFFRRIWRHNLAHEYYRQLEIAKARRQIQRFDNLYAGEKGEKADHENAMKAIVQRFATEYEGDLLRKGEEEKILGDKNTEEKNLKNDIQDLVKQFAGGALSEDQFILEKKKLFGAKLRGVKDLRGESFGKEKALYADNLLEIAKQVKNSIAHGKGLDALDADLEIVIGKARAGVETEAQYNRVDKWIEKVKKTSGGKFASRFVNETTLASAVAIVYGFGVKGTVSAAHKAAKWMGPVGLGVSAGIGGVVAGMRENKRVKEERAQHSREMAKGKKIEAGSERREEMEKFRYETKNAKELSDNLREALEELKKQPSEEKLHKVLDHFNEISSRITFSEQEKVDLISFSNSKNVEQERTEMYVAAAEAKVFLRKNISANWSTFYNNEKELDEYLQHNKEVKIEKDFLKDKTLKDEMFKKMKFNKVAWAVTKGVGIGFGVGLVAQEAIAYSGWNGSQEGLLNSGSAHASDQVHHYTFLEAMRRLVSHDTPRMDVSHMHEVSIGRGANVKLPEGMDLAKNNDGSFNIIQKESQEAIAGNIRFDSDGTLAEESKKILQDRGIFSENILNHIDESKTDGAKDFIKNHENLFSKIKRVGWADNDTVRPDKNELKLWWGGEKGTGVDANGNYVFNMKHMTQSGSFHGGKHWDPQALMKEGKIKMLLSLSQDTQNQVVEIPFDANGNAIIDPNSEIGKIAFENINGHARFLGKFAEVAVVDENSNHVNALATYVGRGMKNILTTTDVHTTVLDFPADYDFDMPYVIPIAGRKPLEQLSREKKEEETASGGLKMAEEEIIEAKSSAIKIEEETDPVRAAAMHTIYKFEDSADRTTYAEAFGAKDDEKKRDKKFLELTKKLWTDLSVHGFVEIDSITGKITIKRESDLDGRSCLKLLKLAGIEVDQNKINYVTMGETAEKGVIMDTSNNHGVIAKEKGKKLIFDHHGKESDRTTSATKFVYETLVEMGLLEKNPYLDKYVEFVTKCDNENYKNDEIKKVFANYSRNLYGLRDKLTIDEIIEFLQKGQDPALPLPDDFIENYKYTKDGKEEFLKDFCKSLQEDIKFSKIIIASMKKEGFVVDTGKNRFGKILIDTKKKNNYPKIPNKSHMAQLAVRVNGYDGYLVWAPRENSFVLYTNRKMDDASIPGGFSEELDLKNVRGNMLMRKRGSVGPLKITLEGLMSKLCGKEFKIEGKIKEAMIVDEKTRNLSELLDENKLTKEILQEAAKDIKVPLRRLLHNLLVQRNGLNKRFSEQARGKKTEKERNQVAIEILLEHQKNRNNNMQKLANAGNESVTQSAPSQESPQTFPQMPPQAPPQAPPQMPQAPQIPQAPENLPDKKQEAISGSVKKMAGLFSNFELSHKAIIEEAGKIQVPPAELAEQFVQENDELRPQFEAKIGSIDRQNEKEVEKLAVPIILNHGVKKSEERMEKVNGEINRLKQKVVLVKNDQERHKLEDKIEDLEDEKIKIGRKRNLLNVSLIKFKTSF